MKSNQLKLLTGFFENELCNNILPFWMNRCEDKENGGFFNCFTNDGTRLISKDKYTWSQGRFVWMFSRLSMMERPFIFAQREEFLRLAKVGRDFLVQHCFMDDEPFRCVYLMDCNGTPKHVPGFEPLDMSISADGFVLIGLCRYSIAANDEESYFLAKRLYISMQERYATKNFNSLPYPLSRKYKAHGLCMGGILHNYEMTLAAQKFEPSFAFVTKKRMREKMDTLFNVYIDEDGALREILYDDNSIVPGVFGNHVNPGHTIEDMWFVQQAADLLEDGSFMPNCVKVMKKTLSIGWDKEYGGLLHFCTTDGKIPKGCDNDPKEETMYQQLLSGWGDKLWWVHGEALYATLLFGVKADDNELMGWFDRIFEYTYNVFPNPNNEVREWVQILTRDGKPQEKVVALPVKDPFHITRDLINILVLLYGISEK